MSYKIRTATLSDEPTLMQLLPRLADFEVPNKRDPKDLWFGDSELMKKVLAGSVTTSHIHVAVDATDTPVAIAMYSIKPELLSGAPSAHLEAIAVNPDHARQGLARKLIDACSEAAKPQGATCMSLNVFSNNSRARALYEACGFDEELIRCYKKL